MFDGVFEDGERAFAVDRGDVTPIFQLQLVQGSHAAVDGRVVENDVQAASSETVVSKAAVTCCASETSAGTATEPARSAAACRTASSLRSTKATRPPSAVMCCAVARPIPEPAPVMKTTLPTKRFPMLPPLMTEASASVSGTCRGHHADRDVRARFSTSGWSNAIGPTAGLLSVHRCGSSPVNVVSVLTESPQIALRVADGGGLAAVIFFHTRFRPSRHPSRRRFAVRRRRPRSPGMSTRARGCRQASCPENVART